MVSWSNRDGVVVVGLYAVQPDIGSESRFQPTPPVFDAPIRGVSRRNIAMMFGMEKLERLGYMPMKIFCIYVIRFDRMYERGGWTDRQTAHDG